MSLPDSTISFLQTHPLLVIDAGARGGLSNWQQLAPWMNVHAFEADTEEAVRLKKSNHNFSSYTVHEKALSSKEETRAFYLAQKRSFSSFLKFNREEFIQHFGRMKDAGKWMNGLETEKIVELKCTSLDLTFS